MWCPWFEERPPLPRKCGFPWLLAAPSVTLMVNGRTEFACGVSSGSVCADPEWLDEELAVYEPFTDAILGRQVATGALSSFPGGTGQLERRRAFRYRLDSRRRSCRGSNRRRCGRHKNTCDLERDHGALRTSASPCHSGAKLSPVGILDDVAGIADVIAASWQLAGLGILVFAMVMVL